MFRYIVSKAEKGRQNMEIYRKHIDTCPLGQLVTAAKSAMGVKQWNKCACMFV